MSDTINITCPHCGYGWSTTLQELDRDDEQPSGGVQYNVVCPKDETYFFITVDEKTTPPTVQSIREETSDEKSLREQTAEAYSISQQAQNALSDGDFDRALGFFQESLRLLEKLGDKMGKAVVLSGMAQIALEQTNLSLALGLYKDSLQLYKQELASDSNNTLAKQGQAGALSQLANVYWEMQDPEQAQDYLEQAVAISKAIEDFEGVAYDTTKLGQLSQARGELESALASYRASLAIFEQLGNVSQARELQRMIAELEEVMPELPAPEDPKSELTKAMGLASKALEQEDIPTAIQHQERVVLLARTLINQKALVVQMVNLAQYYALGERFTEAVSVLDEGLKLGEAIGYPELTTLQQLHKTLNSVAALSPEEKAAAKEELHQTQIVRTAESAREAVLTYLRKQAPKRDVLNFLEETAKRLKEYEPHAKNELEVAALCDALTALITNGITNQSVPAAYVAHFDAVLTEYKKTNS